METFYINKNVLYIFCIKHLCQIFEMNVEIAFYSIIKAAVIAQLGERQTEDLKVPGSIPGRGIEFYTMDH